MKVFKANTPPNKQPRRHFPPPIGKPIFNSEVYVVNSHMQLVPIGGVGELLIGGINLATGYLNRPQLTREKFIHHCFSKNAHAKLYKTGDLVRWLSDGNLEFIGRSDHQIKIRGYRIELSEIETAIANYPDVGEVVVLAKELVNGHKTLIAYLVPNLDKIRIPYQERCLLTSDELSYLQVFSEDISKEGLAVTSLTENFAKSAFIKVNIKLPGSSQPQWLTGRIVWQQKERAGIQFTDTPEQKKLLQRSIEYYLSTHNLMETLQSAAAKRNLRKALKRKLPEYMIPSMFSILPEFPLTFNGKVDWKSLPPPQDFERLLERKYVEPRNKTEKTLSEIWSNILGINPISITDNFFDLGGNSLFVSKLSIEILNNFNISIPHKILFDSPFIPIIAEYIDSNGKQYTHQSSIQNDIHRDAVLHDGILPKRKLSDRLSNPKGILLTGAGGFWVFIYYENYFLNRRTNLLLNSQR